MEKSPGIKFHRERKSLEENYILMHIYPLNQCSRSGKKEVTQQQLEREKVVKIFLVS